MKIKDDFVTDTVGNDHILVATDSNTFSGFVRSNTTASFIIEQLKSNTTRDKIINAMLVKYDAPKEVIEKDVDMVLCNLRKIGALDE